MLMNSMIFIVTSNAAQMNITDVTPIAGVFPFFFGGGGLIQSTACSTTCFYLTNIWFVKLGSLWVGFGSFLPEKNSNQLLLIMLIGNQVECIAFAMTGHSLNIMKAL